MSVLSPTFLPPEEHLLHGYTTQFVYLFTLRLFPFFKKILSNTSRTFLCRFLSDISFISQEEITRNGIAESHKCMFNFL